MDSVLQIYVTNEIPLSQTFRAALDLRYGPGLKLKFRTYKKLLIKLAKGEKKHLTFLCSSLLNSTTSSLRGSSRSRKTTKIIKMNLKTVVLTKNPELKTGIDSTPETLCEKHFWQWIPFNKFMLQTTPKCLHLPE